MAEDPLKHLGLVGSIAKGYQGRGIELADLKQIGFLGLMRACELFDPARKKKFSTYASYWIEEAISEAIRNQARPMRIPQWVRTQLNKGADPDDPTLKPARRECLRAAVRVLDAVRDDGDLDQLVATEPEQDEFAEVAPRLAELDSRDREIIDMRYGLDGSPPLSRRQIGEALSLTGERVRQLEQQAMARLRTG